MVVVLHTRVCMFLVFCLLSLVLCASFALDKLQRADWSSQSGLAGGVGCKTVTAIPEVDFRAALCGSVLWPGGSLSLREIIVMFYF